MIEVTHYTQEGVKGGNTQLPPHLFDLPWSPNFMHQVVTSVMANRRAGAAHTKDRSEVRGGGRKPWKQKGTGRARHGSSRSPIWVGGGVTFGPRSQKNYGKIINKKVRVCAFFMALSERARQGVIQFVALPNVKAPSTKTLASFLTNIYGKDLRGSLVIFSEKDDNLRRSLSNIHGVHMTTLEVVGIQEVLAARRILFVGDAAQVIEYLNIRGANMSAAKEEVAKEEKKEI